MSTQVVLDLPQGKIKFAGIVRGWDDIGHEAYEISLPDRPAMFGEWDTRFAENKTNFNIEIVSFGYLDLANIANPHPAAKQKFSKEETRMIKEIIHAFFLNPEVRDSRSIFKNGCYTEGVVFLPGWIRVI